MNALQKIISLTLTLTFYLNLQAAYLTDVPVKVTQPDGIVLNIFATGDEFYNWLHDENGYTIVQDQTNGYYCYADLVDEQLLPTNFLPGVDDPQTNGLAPEINLPPEVLAQTIDIFTENMPASITREDFLNTEDQVRINNIVIYIRFADQDEFTTKQSFFTDMFNKTGEDVNSVTNYFKEVSYNKVDINTSFYPANDDALILSYQDNEDRSYYSPYHPKTNPNGYDDTDMDITKKKYAREIALLRKALNFVKDEIPADLDLDFNNDNKIDNISFMIRGYADGWSQLLWPHRSFLPSASNIIINGSKAVDFIFLIENYNNSGVICHEIMHVFGAPDLYHYRTNKYPVDKWDVMANPTNPPQHPSAYIKHKYCGWIRNIPEIDGSGLYVVNPLTTEGFNCRKISIKNSNEYLVLEYRKKNGIFENNLLNEGIIIYRINERYWGNLHRNLPEEPGGVYDEVYAFRPEGSISNIGRSSKANFGAEFNRSEFNDFSDPFCFTSDGNTCGLSIEQISVSGNSRMTFRVNFCSNSNIIYNSTSILPPTTEAVNITATGDVIINSTNTTTFEASQEILLNAGFEVKNGSNFTARTVICGEQ